MLVCLRRYYMTLYKLNCEVGLILIYKITLRKTSINSFLLKDPCSEARPNRNGVDQMAVRPSKQGTLGSCNSLPCYTLPLLLQIGLSGLSGTYKCNHCPPDGE